MTAVVELESVRKEYAGGVVAVRDVSLTVSAGEFVAIVGPSGGHAYALLVDDVEDVVEASGAVSPVGAPLGHGWDRVALGMVEAEGELFLLVDPHALIAGPAARAA